MTQHHDPFRPRHAPASTLYDAFQAEAAKRRGRDVNEWLEAERNVVWSMARDLAQQQGLPVPTMEQIKLKEGLAMGHIDYGSKWAIGVVELLRPHPQTAHRERA